MDDIKKGSPLSITITGIIALLSVAMCCYLAYVYIGIQPPAQMTDSQELALRAAQYAANPQVMDGGKRLAPIYMDTSIWQRLAITLPDKSACTYSVSERPATPIDLSSRSGLIVSTDETSYSIPASSEFDMWSAIANCNTQFHNGHEVANTSYWLDWSYGTSADGQACTITNPAVGLHVTTLFPKWVPGPHASSSLASKWSTFITHLYTHEDGHAALAKQYAADMYSYLSGLSTGYACAPPKQAIDAHLQDEIAQLNTANASYDRQTGNGKTQGVVIDFNIQ